jgi:hypothetical protein
MLPDWFPGFVGATVIVHLTTFFICDASDFDTDGGAFENIVRHSTFQSCGQLEEWIQWTMFFLFTFVWLLIGVVLVLPLATGLLANPIAGTIAGLAVVALIVSFIVF